MTSRDEMNAAGLEAARKRLQWISDARHDENADLDSICTYADQALAALASLPKGNAEAALVPPDTEGEAQPVAWIDIHGQVSIPEGSKLGDILRALPKPPVGKACLPLFLRASPSPSSPEDGR